MEKESEVSHLKELMETRFAANWKVFEKSEAGFTKQIDQIGSIINSQAKVMDDKFDDLKSRLQGNMWPMLLAMASLIISIVTVIVLMIAHLAP